MWYSCYCGTCSMLMLTTNHFQTSSNVFFKILLIRTIIFPIKDSCYHICWVVKAHNYFPEAWYATSNASNPRYWGMWSIWHTLTKIEQRVAFNDTADDVMYTVHWFAMVLPSIYVSVNQHSYYTKQIINMHLKVNK